jgi:CubicO group peptidase (beta-lactamase class C family)
MVEMYNPYLALSEETGGLLQAGEVDWTTAFAIYQPKSGRRREGFGRLPGSCGWGGAAGTEYWIDREAGIAVSAESNQFLPLTGTEENNLQVTFTTQMLPGNGPVVKTAKKRIEKAVYEALGI